MPTISVVIPVLNGAAFLQRCLASLKCSHTPALEYIVVDDGSSDGSCAIAEAYGAMVLRTKGRTGPASARNLGARCASGELLVFLDADVCVHGDTLSRIQSRFEQDFALDAVLGSYDDEPAAHGFVSQYKNLQHHYVHQHGQPEASTFWSGCGAIRAGVFRSFDGFDESYARPCIEDIELGYRLRTAHRRMLLDPAIQVKHLKCYRVGSWLRSDIFDRALPWTRLIMCQGKIPNDLNLAVGQRASGALALLAAALVPACLATEAPLLLAGLPLAAAGLLNWDFCHFLTRKRGLVFAARAVPLLLAYYLYSTLAFAAGVALHLPEWRRYPESQLGGDCKPAVKAGD